MKTMSGKIGVVEKMRVIRENLSLEIMDMTIEQEREYVRAQLAKLKAKKRIS